MAKGRRVYSTDATPTRRPRPVRSRPPAEQTIYVERSRKGRKGKTVTIMSGFQLSADDLKSLLKNLKSLCGAGGTGRDQETIEIQGDHRDRLLDHLATLGYKVKQKGG